jgi:hypothetical protein
MPGRRGGAAGAITRRSTPPLRAGGAARGWRKKREEKGETRGWEKRRSHWSTGSAIARPGVTASGETRNCEREVDVGRKKHEGEKR